MTSLPGKKLGVGEFKVLLNVFNIVGNSCSDLMIKNGKICQSSDDTRSLFKCDLTPIIGDTNLNIVRIADVARILEIFNKQGSEVYINNTGTACTFYDEKSEYKTVQPIDQYVSNKYKTQEEFELTTHADNRIILVTGEPFDKNVCDRFAHISKQMSTTNTIIRFDRSKVKFLLSPSDEKNATIFDVISIGGLNDDLTGSGKLSLDFIFNCNPPLSISLAYVPGEGNKTVTLKSEFKIGLNQNDTLDMEVWGFAIIK